MKNRIVRKLPAIFQTDANKEFFDATFDQLFSPRNVERINGFVGRKSGSVYNVEEDAYVSEPTLLRSAYQLEPMAYSKDGDNNDINQFFYEDMLNYLRFSKGDIGNHDKLFSDRYYSFAPPIDVDKFINFQNYVWIPESVPSIFIEGIDDAQVEALILGQEEFNTDQVTGATPPGVQFTSGMRVRFVNSTRYNTRLYVEGVGRSIRLVPELPAVFADGRLEFLPWDELPEGPNTFWDAMPWDIDRTIRLDDKDYITIERGSIDNNQWSRTNRWFHIDVINIVESIGQIRTADVVEGGTGYAIGDEFTVQGDGQNATIEVVGITGSGEITQVQITNPGFGYLNPTVDDNDPFNPLSDGVGTGAILSVGIQPQVNRNRRARRPIIEFRRDLELYDSPTRTVGSIDVVIANQTRSALSGLTAPQTIDTVTLEDGMRVIFLQPDSATPDVREYVWRVVKPTPSSPLSFVRTNVYQDFPNEIPGAVRKVCENHGVIVLRGDDYFGKTMTRRGNGWVEGQQKEGLNQAPLFVLYDTEGVRLDDTTVYPASDFEGNKIFSYKVDEVGLNPDPELGFRRVTTGLGQITDTVFDNNLEVDRYTYQFSGAPRENIQGYYYFKEFNIVIEGAPDEIAQTVIAPTPATGEEIVFSNLTANSADHVFIVLPQIPLRITNFVVNNLDPVTVTIDPSELAVVPGIQITALVSPCNDGDDEFTLETNWRSATDIAKQRVIDRFLVENDPQLEYVPSVTPVDDDIRVVVNGTRLNDSEYIYVPATNTIVLASAPAIDSIVELLTYTHDPRIPADSDAYFEIPNALEKNPNNLDVFANSWNDFSRHFISIIENQDVYEGAAFGAGNNFRDTEKDGSRGNFILQNQSPLLKAMLMSSDQELDILKALRLSQREYTRYKNKVVKYAQMLINEGFTPFNAGDIIPVSQWMDEIVKRIVKGREFSNAFEDTYMIAWSNVFDEEVFISAGVPTYTISEFVDLTDKKNVMYVYVNGELQTVDRDYTITNLNPIEVEFATAPTAGDEVVFRLYENSTPAHIPATPSKLGMYGVQIPRIELDETYPTPTEVIVGHDGTRTPIFGDYTDDILLEFETRIYNGIIEKFRIDYNLPLKTEKVRPGFFRDTRWTQQQWLDLLKGAFFKWSTYNNADFRENEFATAGDPWTWNYSGLDFGGFTLQGSWRAIFRTFYDTETPHLTPWEMLGFAEQPEWWEAEYGPGPWGSADPMWQDLEDGVIRQGNREGVDDRYARPDLIANHLPVDAAGALLPTPLACIGYIGPGPTPDQQQAPWKFGDIGPVEYAWLTSEAYPYHLMEALFLARPGEFGEKLFAPEWFERLLIDLAQIVSVENGVLRRVGNSNLRVHGEIINGQTVVQTGYQVLVSSRLKALGRTNITTAFGSKVRGLDVKLGHRMAGFTNEETLRVFVEGVSASANTTNLLVPTENITVDIHTGPPVREYFYGGVLVKTLADGTYQIFGYDAITEEFRYIPRKTSFQDQNVNVGGQPASFVNWQPNRTYQIGDLIRLNGTFYRSLVTHTPAKFETSDWQRLAKLPTVGGINVTYKPEGEDFFSTYDYGTILSSPQEVFDFLIGYGEFLTREGFVFENLNENTGELDNWLAAAKQFLFWIATNWEADSVIQLSPAALGVELNVGIGYPANVERIINDVYSILNKDGVVIDPNSTLIRRDDRNIRCIPTLDGQSIYAFRVNTNETESIVSFDNVTRFDDVLYDPLFGVRQERLLFNGIRTLGWIGKLEAGGYIITENGLVPNFENLVNSIRLYHDTEDFVDNPQIENVARHLIGFEEREYMNDLQILDDNQYLFYQGFLRAKGTTTAIRNIQRNRNISAGVDELDIYEEWALKIAEYGGLCNNVRTEFLIESGEVKADPQLVELDYPKSRSTGVVHRIKVISATNTWSTPPPVIIQTNSLDDTGSGATATAVLDNDGKLIRIDILNPGSDYKLPPIVYIGSTTITPTSDRAIAELRFDITPDNPGDDIILIDIDDKKRWPTKPGDVACSNPIELWATEFAQRYEIPNAGYVHLDDVDYSIFSADQLFDVWNRADPPVLGSTIHIARDNTNDWGVYQVDNNFSAIEAISGFGTLEFSSGLQTGTNAIFSVEIGEDGTLDNLTLLDGGSGVDGDGPETFTVVRAAIDPSATGTTITPATISYTVTGGTIQTSSENLDTAGAGYGLPFTVTTEIPPVAATNAGQFELATDNNGSLDDVTITNSGSGYVSNFTFNVPGGTGGVLDVIVSGGEIQNTTSIDSAGTGYGLPETNVSIDVPAATPSQAANVNVSILAGVQADVEVVVGTVVVDASPLGIFTFSFLEEVIINDGGQGYLNGGNGTLLLENICGIGGEIELSVTNGVITGWVINNSGYQFAATGYNNTPGSDRNPNESPANAPQGVEALLSAFPVSNSLDEVTVVDGGFGYSDGSITVTDIGGFGGVVNLQISNNSIVSGIVTNPGAGYSLPGPINISGDIPLPVVPPGNEEDAEILININSSGQVTGPLTLVDGGKGYYQPGTINVTFGGNPGGTGAVISYTVNSAAEIDNITLVSSGSGYANPRVFTVNAPAPVGGGIPAVVDIGIDENGEVATATIVSAGTGFFTTEIYSVVGTLNPSFTGTGGLIQVVGSGSGAVTSVNILANGQNYLTTTPATITVAGDNIINRTYTLSFNGRNVTFTPANTVDLSTMRALINNQLAGTGIEVFRIGTNLIFNSTSVPTLTISAASNEDEDDWVSETGIDWFGTHTFEIIARQDLTFDIATPALTSLSVNAGSTLSTPTVGNIIDTINNASIPGVVAEERNNRLVIRSRFNDSLAVDGNAAWIRDVGINVSTVGARVELRRQVNETSELDNIDYEPGLMIFNSALVTNELLGTRNSILDGYVVIENNLYKYEFVDVISSDEWLYVLSDENGPVEDNTFNEDDDTDVDLAAGYLYNLRFRNVVDYNDNIDAVESLDPAPQYIWSDSNSPWAVYNVDPTTYNLSLFRQENELVVTSFFKNAFVYDKETKDTIVQLPVYDPFKGLLPGPADRNITYKTVTDPARYTVASEAALVNPAKTFDRRNVGEVWWDLSTCAYVWYEQGSNRYRRDNWGRLVSGSSIDIYEWTRSSVPPMAYEGDGTPRNTTDYALIREFDPLLEEFRDIYYFWVKNRTTIPSSRQRSMSVSAVARMIRNPVAQLFRWFSPISENAFIFAGNEGVFADSDNMFQINYTKTGNNNNRHVEWVLGAEDDPRYVPNEKHLNKMVDSLVGITAPIRIDGDGTSFEPVPLNNYANAVPIDSEFGYLLVPDPTLSETQKYGIKTRPMQGMFKHQSSARKIFVDKVNALLSPKLTRDENELWNTGFNTTTLWEWVDWWAPGRDEANSVPSRRVDLVVDLASITDAFDGEVIRVLGTATGGRSSLYAFNQETGLFDLIYREATRLELKSEIYEDDFNIPAAVELRELINALFTNVLNQNEINEVFFAMLNYVFSEQENLDWAFKTTYIQLRQRGQTLRQENVFQVNPFESVEKYITEAKPYHTKLRDYAVVRELETDLLPGTAEELERNFKLKIIFDRFMCSLSIVNIRIARNLPNFNGYARFGSRDGIWDYLINQFTGNGTTNTFTLTQPPELDYIVVIVPPGGDYFEDGVVQILNQDYIYDGFNIEFAVAPALGSEIFIFGNVWEEDDDAEWGPLLAAPFELRLGAAGRIAATAVDLHDSIPVINSTIYEDFLADEVPITQEELEAAAEINKRIFEQLRCYFEGVTYDNYPLGRRVPWDFAPWDTNTWDGDTELTTQTFSSEPEFERIPEETFTAVAGQQVFGLTTTVPNFLIEVKVNNVLAIRNVDYFFVGNTIQFVNPLAADDEVELFTYIDAGEFPNPQVTEGLADEVLPLDFKETLVINVKFDE